MENVKFNMSSVDWINNVRDRFVPFVSRYANTKQLTLCSLAWNSMIVMTGLVICVHPERAYLWLVAAALALHYLTDIFDGAVGRYMDEGYVKWGYVMDHLFDTLIVLTTSFALMCFLHARGQPAACIALFATMTCTVIVMTFSFLSLNSFGGLDMSVCLYDDDKGIGQWCVNVVYSVFMLIALIVYVWSCDGQVNVPFMVLAALVSLALTAWHVYRKQRALSHMDEALKAKVGRQE